MPTFDRNKLDISKIQVVAVDPPVILSPSNSMVKWQNIQGFVRWHKNYISLHTHFHFFDLLYFLFFNITIFYLYFTYLCNFYFYVLIFIALIFHSLFKIVLYKKLNFK